MTCSFYSFSFFSLWILFCVSCELYSYYYLLRHLTVCKTHTETPVNIEFNRNNNKQFNNLPISFYWFLLLSSIFAHSVCHSFIFFFLIWHSLIHSFIESFTSLKEHKLYFTIYIFMRYAEGVFIAYLAISTTANNNNSNNMSNKIPFIIHGVYNNQSLKRKRFALLIVDE